MIIGILHCFQPEVEHCKKEVINNLKTFGVNASEITETIIHVA